MIAYLKGILTYINDETIIVDVNGIGYEVVCANPFAFQSSLNESIHVYTYHHVREDMQVLYGFKNESEKELFKKLISVSGIGPKSGLAIQGNVDVDSFVLAVEREDEKFLTQFPGVGKKTARQIILDLKGKLTDLTYEKVDEQEDKKQPSLQQMSDVEDALIALGYTPHEIRPVLNELDTDSDLDELIKKALNLLAKQ